MQLTECVHLVGSGQVGFDLTNPYDCHVYLLDGGTDLALIDAGVGLDSDAILGNVVAAGHDPARISDVLLTHAHADHAGGAADLKAATGATVRAPRAAVAWLATGDEDAVSLGAARRAGVYPSDYHLTPCTAVQAMDDGDTIALGDLNLRVIDTPGHAAVHQSFLLSGDTRPALFSGDVVFHGGRVLLLNTPDCSISALGRSLARLRDETFEALFPGHGAVSLQRGLRHVEAALEAFERMGVPPPFM